MPESEHQRSQRASDLAETAIEEARRLAYEKGQSDARLSTRINDNKARLDAMNGSIDNLAQAVRTIENREQARDAVARATKDAVEEHGKAQISARQFYVGVVGVIISLGALFIAALVALNPPA